MTTLPRGGCSLSPEERAAVRWKLEFMDRAGDLTLLAWVRRICANQLVKTARSLFVLASTLSLVGAAAAGAADAPLFPFVLPWDDATPSLTDLSGWLEKPAGKHGPVRVGPDAHFYAGDRRIRFLGVNLAFAAGMPAKGDGEKIAARLAKFGINVVRFHHMDTSAWPSGLRRRDAPDTGQLDPEALDRLDYFVAQLKARGIYANLNLLVGRPFNAADGLPREIETMDWKDRHVVGFWNAKELELQKDYARRLLTHANPYTRSDYTSEPAVAFIEINNENGLVHAWLGGRVDSYPEVFTRDLQEQWNDWLKRRYEGTVKLRGAWSEGAQALGPELLSNGDFRRPLTHWNLERHDGAEASVKTAGVAAAGASPALELRVVKPGSESWHVQLNQGGLQLESGQAYTVSFRAKSARPRPISVGVSQGHGPYANLGLSANAPLTNEWREFRFVFNASQTDDRARISFANLGGADSVIQLADVSLKPGGVEGLRAGEAAGTIAWFPKSSFGQRTAAAQRDWIRFLTETEDRYWQAMYHFIKDELKARALVGGTIGGCSPLNVQAKLDWLDTHAYWQHPRFPHKPWDPADWIVDNKTMVNERGGTLPGLALKRVAGKPHAVTEYNHPAPNTFSSEGFLLLAAYGALQDWDAIYAYGYAHTRNGTSGWDSRKINGFFDIDQHPTKMATLVSAAAMFLRGDVKPAGTLVRAGLPWETEVELLRTAGAWSLVDAAKAGLARETPLVNRVAVSRSAVPVPKLAFPGPRYESDTGELVWDTSEAGRGVVTINSPSTKGVIGYGGGKSFNLGRITIEPGATMQEGWSTITVSALPAARSGTEDRARDRGAVVYLVTATGYAENTGMDWKNAEKNTVGRDWGTAPARVEGVPAKITFDVAASEKARAWALDERGRRRAEMPMAVANGKAALNVGPKWQTLWYEVLVWSDSARSQQFVP
jgi:hypothetical protein